MYQCLDRQVLFPLQCPPSEIHLIPGESVPLRMISVYGWHGHPITIKAPQLPGHWTDIQPFFQLALTFIPGQVS